MNFPELIYAEASVISSGGRSLFDADEIRANNVKNFYSERTRIEEAISKLKLAGFKVISHNEISITIAGSKSLYETTFSNSLTTRERFVRKYLGTENKGTHVEVNDSSVRSYIDTSTSDFKNLLEGICINVPFYNLSESINPPQVPYWHLQLPGDLQDGLKATPILQNQIDGAGVKVAIVDSGFHMHPYFETQGYNMPNLVFDDSIDDFEDHDGHGTAMAANLLAIAPSADLHCVKYNKGSINSAFNKAMELQPEIISCSWNSNIKTPAFMAPVRALEASIAKAVKCGITVIAAAGNGEFAFPGQHPDVISVGGTYQYENGNLEASQIASGFSSRIYEGRNVPDICGLVGRELGDRYIMLPVPSGSSYDKHTSTRSFGDQTEPDDGWAVFSGTSSATAQVAGVCALIKQKFPQISPQQIKSVLKLSARDVQVGQCAMQTGHKAKIGEDLATGFGLVNAEKALKVAEAILE